MNRIYNLSKISIFITIITFISCTPPAVFQHQPEPEEEFYEETEMLVGADSIFQCYMSYEFRDGDFLVFYVHLVNYSVLSTSFDPSECYLEYEVPSDNMYSDPNLRVYSLDPDIEIRSLAEAKEESESRNSFSLGLNIVSAVVDIAANVFDGVSANDIEILDDLIYWGGNISANVEQSELDTEYYEGAEMFWKNDVLRKTILKSGEDTGGLVYFPVHKRSPEFFAIVPYSGTINTFEFDLSN